VIQIKITPLIQHFKNGMPITFKHEKEEVK